MQSFLELFSNITVGVVVSWITAFCFMCGIVGKVAPKIFKWYDRRKADREVLDRYKIDIEKIYDSIKKSNDTVNDKILEINKNVNCICQAQVESLNDRIRQKCKYYFSIGYIPEDEFEDFKRIMETYINIGGNHGLKAKFDKTLELPVKIKED